MEFLILPLVAAAASLLTFYSGFGLGTLLTPVFAIFFPVEIAVALTAIVHLLNNLFKLALVGRHADKNTVLQFGLPALIAAAAGAWLLTRLSDLPPAGSYQLFGRDFQMLWIKLVIAILMAGFTLFELVPRLKNLQIDRRYLKLGGVLSGFFGGLSGHQGALRSAFLVRLGLSKETFIATGVVIACMIDVVRLAVYSEKMTGEGVTGNLPLLSAVTLAAFAGAYLGSRFLVKITMDSIQTMVAIMLLLLSAALGIGLI